MNKYLSVIALAARHTIYKVMAVTAVAAAAVGALMVRLPIMEKNEAHLVIDPLYVPRDLDVVPSQSLATLACLAGFLAIMLLLSLNGCGFGTKSDYTVCRLRVDEGKASLLWAACYTVCILLYWAAMAAVCYWAVCRRVAMLAADPRWGYLAGPQSRMLTFYSSPFLHHLLPLADIAVWVEDVLFAALCGAAAMEFSRQQRKGRISVAPLFAAGMTAASFFFPMGSWINLFFLFIPVACLIMTILRRGDETDESTVPAVS